jgi:3-hydroxymyristoyl/3-hydroxydecanoyl-(acyl carrier protein) dehydratase
MSAADTDMALTSLQFASDHPAFAGHFPGRPIVPGVLLLDAVKLAIEDSVGVKLAGLAVAKFHSPAGPGEAMQVEFDVEAAAVRFLVRAGARKIADGRFLLADRAS